MGSIDDKAQGLLWGSKKGVLNPGSVQQRLHGVQKKQMCLKDFYLKQRAEWVALWKSAALGNVCSSSLSQTHGAAAMVQGAWLYLNLAAESSIRYMVSLLPLFVAFRIKELQGH